MRNRLCGLTIAVALALVIAGCGQLGQQASRYPTKPIELIVPWAPGAAADLSARLVATYASKKLGQQVTVVNKPGASGVPGSLEALTAAPDGYKLLHDGNTTASFLAATRTDLPPELGIDKRTYIGRTTTEYPYYVVFSGAPWQDLKEAMAAAKSDPDAFTWGAGAFGSVPMLTGLKLLDAAGVDPQRTKMVVFEQGNAPAIQALAGGNVLFGIAFATDLDTLLPSGRIRALGAAAPERTPERPEIPSVKEQGFPGAELSFWYGISGPPGLPDNVVQAWQKVLSDANNDPEMQQEALKLKKSYSYLAGSELRGLLDEEYKSTLSIIEKSGVKSQS